MRKPNLMMNKGSVLFLDTFFVFVLSILLILSGMLMLRNWNTTLVYDGISEVAFSLAVDWSENLINSPGCLYRNCSEIWSGRGSPEIPGFAYVGDSGVIQNYVLDPQKLVPVSLPSESLGGREVNYKIRIKRNGVWEALANATKDPEIGIFIVRRPVLVRGDENASILEVSVIV